MTASGLVFNIQKYSVQDGPGIRTTVFLKGCPLRCAWCHNPEGISSKPEIISVQGRCIGCGECRLACPSGASAPGEGALPLRSETCVLCGACVEACPTGARQLVGRQISVPELLETVLRDRIFYEDSGGGVTFSGGEPVSQPEFLRECLLACRAQGLHTAVDTCGLVPTADLLAIAGVTDLFLYDLKLMDEARHREYTGVPNGLILGNLKALGRVHANIWLRVPVVPGLNDAPADLQATARFAATIPGVRQVNVLPFHRTGLSKAARLGQSSRVAEVQPPSALAMREAVEIFQSAGLSAKAAG